MKMVKNKILIMHLYLIILNFSLYSFTATAENGLQIIEQILPFFQPEYTVTMNVVPELDI